MQKLLELISYLQLPHNSNCYFKNTFTLCLFLKATYLFSSLHCALSLVRASNIGEIKSSWAARLHSGLYINTESLESRIRGCSHQNMMLRSGVLQQCMKWRVSFCCWATIGNKLLFFSSFFQNLLRSFPIISN